MDFSIADKFGTKAIIDTYNRAFKEWKTNTEYVTELLIVLNHKLWQHYEGGNQAYAELYNELWETCSIWCEENLKGDDLRYYYETTD